MKLKLIISVFIFNICAAFNVKAQAQLLGCWTSKSIQKWEPNLHESSFDYDTLYIKKNKSFSWIKHYNGLVPTFESGNWEIINDTLFLLSKRESIYFKWSRNKSKPIKPFNIVNKVTKLIIENKGASGEYFRFIENDQCHQFEEIK